MSALRVTCRVEDGGLVVLVSGGRHVPDRRFGAVDMDEAWTTARLASEAEADATRGPEPGW